MKLGDNIKAHRKNRGLSQKKFAEMMDLPVSTLANYENNHREPNLKTLNDMCENLMISIQDLIPNDIERWDKEITPKIHLAKISTNELVEELNSRDDFPIKINLK